MLINEEIENKLSLNNRIVGLFQSNKNFGFVVPDDRKIRTDIFIPKKNFNGAKNNQKVIIKITREMSEGKKPEGKVIDVIGGINQAGVDMLSLIAEYKLPYEFPKPVNIEAKLVEKEIRNPDLSNRTDFRDKEIFTIDGEDAKDLDDAVCVDKLDNGNYLLGVHIADVSNYVRENTNLNKEAIIRGTSIYMMDRVIPMLPQQLSNGICSLNEGKDRYTISVIMEINPRGEVVSSDIKKGIINVTKRMSYNGVYNLLEYVESKSANVDMELVKEYERYTEHLVRMKELSLILKERRSRAGSLELNVPESKITLNKKGVAVNVEKYETTYANEIIEQFMLTANETVAEKFYWLEVPFIYRVHQTPDIDKIQELNKFLWNLGYKIKANKNSIHSKAFAQVLEEVKGKPEERIVSNLILRTLKVAQYESENLGHFGIASKYYCHFTSPIRRYPDLFIHRVISKYIENGYNIPEDEVQRLSDEATKYARLSSEREKIAQKVERDSEDIKKAEYMENKIGEEYEGIISNVTSFGIFVELDNTIEGLIRFENLGNEYYEYDEEHKRLVGESSKELFNIGDKISVRVVEANKESRRISFERIIEKSEDEKMVY